MINESKAELNGFSLLIKFSILSISEPVFFTLAGINNDLELRLRKPVDIVTYTDTMNSFLKKQIDHETVYA